MCSIRKLPALTHLSDANFGPAQVVQISSQDLRSFQFDEIGAVYLILAIRSWPHLSTAWSVIWCITAARAAHLGMHRATEVITTWRTVVETIHENAVGAEGVNR